MYLKRLELKGFKSFADNTEINLKPGVNIVVGPNGCGKSNVIDAIRWVLGESNIRNLRGQTFEDVIFNGTDSKKALGMATVEMTIDNSCHSLPVDYGEVTTGRKVYRSGESEFYLNKSKVRLKDITNLFTGTGLGKKGYSIISQGELEQVLNAQGFERRLILEEASGIIKHRQQRDEVNRRITATSNDLTRLQDILTELETRKNELQTKAEKAKTYLAISEECTELEKTLLEHELNKTGKDLRQKNEIITAKQQTEGELRLDIEQKEQELRLQEQQINIEQTNGNNFKEKKFTLENQINNLQADKVLCQEKIRNCKERINSAVADEDKYGPMLDKLEQDLKMTIQDYQAEKQKYGQKHQEIQALTGEINDLEQEIEACVSCFEKAKEQIFERINQESMLKNQITEKQLGTNRTREKRERLVIHIEESAAKLKTLRENLKNLEAKGKDNLIKLNSVEKELNVWEEKKVELNAALQSMEQEYKQHNRDLITLENKQISIRDMNKNYTGYSEGVRALLSSWKKGTQELKGILGVIGSLIDVPLGMEMAIDMAVGKGLENIVVEKAEQAQKAIHYLKKNRLGRATFLPLDILKTQPVPGKVLEAVISLEGVLGIAANLVSYEVRFKKAVEYLLGRILIVDNLDHGIKVFKSIHYPLRIVTLEGEVINVSGAMSGGTKPIHNNSPLQRRNEEKRIKNVWEEKKQAIKQLNEKIDKVNINLAEVENSLADARNNLLEYQFQRDMLAKEIEKIYADTDFCVQTRDKNLQDLTVLDEQIKEFTRDITELESRYAAVKQENRQSSDELEENKVTVDKKKRDYEVRKERLISYNDQLKMKKRELENTEKNINQLEEVKRSYQDSLGKAKITKEKMFQETNALEERIIKLNYEINELHLELEKAILGIDRARDNEKINIEKANQMRAALLPRKNELVDLEGSIRNLEIQRARLETELDGIHARWKEHFNSEPPANTDKILPNQELREYKKRTAELYQTIEELGPVDITSIQEYDEVSNRNEFLHNQYFDLLEARKSLGNLLQETENMMVKSFSHFMMLASESFKITFNQIFGGGDAYLKLEPGNKFDGGIDIVVKMPGKKHQPLNLLSGGERALTCIAFIFSLLRLRPAPFCLLDEIDAALDEVNLLRFANFLKEMAADMQFVVITHRQVTIEAGDNIYGITMPEEGVSAVLTLNYEEAESLAG